MKKTILFVIALLIACDLTLVIAAQAQQSDSDLQQLRALQQAGRTRQPMTPTRAQRPTLAEQLRAARTEQAAPVAAPTPTTQPSAQPTPTQVTTQAKAMPQQTDSELARRAIDERAFRQVLTNLMPLTPEQILRLRKQYNVIELAKEATPKAPPRPVASTQKVELAPGSTPPVVRLSKGYVSSVVFLDSTGAPWPIQDYDLGNPDAFNIQWDKKSNTLMIQAKKLYTYGNIAIRLQGLATPVMMTLVPGQRAVDYRADLRIHGFGPNAQQVSTSQELPDGADDALLSILDGVPPVGGKLLAVKGGDAQVWTRGESMFVRTRLKILSPGWLAYMSSADGMQVYKMQKTPSLLVALPQQGKTTNLKITGW